MQTRPAFGRAFRSLALASLLVGLFAGGIAVAMRMEEAMLGGIEDEIRIGYGRPTTGLFDLAFACWGPPSPPFELLGPILVPFLLASFLPVRRLVTLRLRD